MNKRSSIQSVLGWILLLVFAFSITPRQILHDVLADHQDLSNKLPAHGTAVAKKGFSCDRLNLVAESPFTECDEAAVAIISLPLTEFVSFFDHSYTPKAFTLHSLRGPPGI